MESKTKCYLIDFSLAFYDFGYIFGKNNRDIRPSSKKLNFNEIMDITSAIPKKWLNIDNDKARFLAEIIEKKTNRKENFSMRCLYQYRVVRYYPFIGSDEFFNVAIWIKNENEEKKIYIDDKGHLQKLDEFYAIKQELAFLLNKFKQETDYENWYGNHISIGEKQIFISKLDIDSVAKILYHDYIGYKFLKKMKNAIIETSNNQESIFEEARNYTKDFICSNYNDILEIEHMKKRDIAKKYQEQ